MFGLHLSDLRSSSHGARSTVTKRRLPTRKSRATGTIRRYNAMIIPDAYPFPLKTTSSQPLPETYISSSKSPTLPFSSSPKCTEGKPLMMFNCSTVSTMMTSSTMSFVFNVTAAPANFTFASVPAASLLRSMASPQVSSTA
ncbi:hypothetical protein EJ06DRAFT_174249 [Trichodelitschia bisporula]|uniref:Uncharacterized protein n=1 Tax=Trichodelitschia bisporula TaxID=703511 RepID=A0A6G1HLY2_9PEZI|nr:hypothetical protein EJ06DRAFT_174249 [Trichodelitschia bisporula]